MTTATERLTIRSPGRMESHCVHRALAHPHCTLQHLDTEDLNQTMCDALPEDEKKLLVRTDEASFRLNVQFIRAHGVPKGEFTTLSLGGGLSCSPQQRE